MRDMTTPLTYVRYTGNWQGSHQGWMITPETGLYHLKNPGAKAIHLGIASCR